MIFIYIKSKLLHGRVIKQSIDKQVEKVRTGEIYHATVVCFTFVYPEFELGKG